MPYSPKPSPSSNRRRNLNQPPSSTATTAATTALTRALSPTPTPRSSSLATPSSRNTTSNLHPTTPSRTSSLSLSRNPSPSPARPKEEPGHYNMQDSPEDELSALQQENLHLKDNINALDAQNTLLRDTLRQVKTDHRQELAQLQDQIRGLKEFVSKSGNGGAGINGSGQTTSDEVFEEGMGKLGNGLQNWVLVYWRRSKIDLSHASEATLTELDRLVPTYRDLVSTAKIHLLQSLVSRLLTESIFNTYFVGLSPSEADKLAEAEKSLGTYATSPEMMSQWRSLTLAILQKDASGKLQRETSTIVDALVAKVNRLLDEITSSKSNDARDQGLRSLIASAVDLSRLLAVQKAVFAVHMPQVLPHQQIMFDAETMEDIGGEDEEGLFEREISCVTFPGIIKRGDEIGGHLQFRNVISKARVLCCPE
ncbi:uncharacterized protein PODANS_3_7180 [Podospora anserina S mat+]|uniref:Podospora anserina S mat+ genomic DNA chromosome 3, supercontig 2 n=1 Tax=Podospora anserina (strain S / ATCC MYA-4624 / DSM 980 / FGSC 10383) TaxID=515849 RepID=B2B0S8_PODAN|nr:uncharacterized protein PODANS_3_7180 [Podospora anserina S mat+]CAP70653.1 unnamed protein product [Podospora anserina S mat+]CDP27242.1 Putative protein of unknown function [Podospora anserina S mat+]